MYDDRFKRRKAHALKELRLRGVIKDRVPWMMRLFMAVFPRRIPPYYGSHAAYGAMIGVFFGLPFMLALGGVFALDAVIPVWAGVAVGAFAGVLFGGMMGLYMKSVHSSLKLSDWQNLDRPPATEAPEGATGIDEVNARWEAGLGAATLATVATGRLSPADSN